jgi:hypothetical protein
MDSVRELLKSKYDLDSISLDILFDTLKKEQNQKLKCTIVEMNNGLYIQQDFNKSLHPLDRHEYVKEIINSLHKLQNGEFSNVTTYNQDRLFRYLFGKIRLLENDRQTVKEPAKEVSNPVSETVKPEPKTKNTTDTHDYKYYQTICEKIAHDNQYYHLILVNKKTNEYANYKYCRYQPRYDAFGAMNCHGLKNTYAYSDLKAEYDSAGRFPLLDNSEFAIHIQGIKEPNVYDIIEKLKVEYGIYE